MEEIRFAPPNKIMVENPWLGGIYKKPGFLKGGASEDVATIHSIR